jgi:IMP dehydrogenase
MTTSSRGYENAKAPRIPKIAPEAPISEALKLMEKYRISGVPATVEGKLVGILTNRDLRFETRLTKKVSDVMTKDRSLSTDVANFCHD